MKGNQWETRERKENKGKPMENERRTCSKNICCLSRYVSVSYYGFIVSFLLLCLCLCVCLSVRLSARVWEVSLYLSRSLCVSVSLFLLVSVLFVSLICFLLSVCPVERQMCACIFVCVFLFSFFGSLYLPPFVSVFPTGGLEPFEDEWAFLHSSLLPLPFKQLISGEQGWRKFGQRLKKWKFENVEATWSKLIDSIGNLNWGFGSQWSGSSWWWFWKSRRFFIWRWVRLSEFVFPLHLEVDMKHLLVTWNSATHHYALHAGAMSLGRNHLSAGKHVSIFQWMRGFMNNVHMLDCINTGSAIAALPASLRCSS